MINVTVWNENFVEKNFPQVLECYPNGMHGILKDIIGTMDDVNVRTATQDEPESGLPETVLNNTDVLVWWAHVKHNDIPDTLARKITNRVLQGMGLIVLHSAHDSKPFKMLMGTSCSLGWRDNDYERLWLVDPGHPIAQGVPNSIEIPGEEMYGERFNIPQPDELVFIGWFRGGEVFRSGCCWHRGAGKVFYFQPGHETNTSYYNPHVRKIICNAVKWAAPSWRDISIYCEHRKISSESALNSDSE